MSLSSTPSGDEFLYRGGAEMSSPNTSDQYLTLQDAARRLALQPKTLYRPEWLARLRAIKLPNGRWRVPLDAVDALLVAPRPS